MKVTGIIHQQICQLKWYLLACLGLIMVLPVEEAIVNLKEGNGFFTDGMAFAAILIGPLLAGLIACANVQADLDEKRYIFWRSKPANINLLITIKFFIGLIISLFLIACPIVFHIVSYIIWQQGDLDKIFFMFYVPVPILIAIMTYSLCFASNVLVRKTARAWLIGMLIGCFLLVLPFILPLDVRDYMHDIIFWSRGAFLAILLITPAAAFVFAIYAAKFDWQLKTNFKWLLWAGTGLVFILLMLFSSQVANIRVLQEKQFDLIGGFRWPLIDKAGDKLIFQGQNYIQTEKDNISLIDITEVPDYMIRNDIPKIEGYLVENYPKYGQLYKKVGDNLYSIAIHAYYRREGAGPSYQKSFEKIYLRSYNHKDKWKPVCELDVSDSLSSRKRWIRMAMRFIDNRLIVCVNDSCFLLDATDPGDLKIIEQKIDLLTSYLPFTFKNRKEEFAIPLIPIEEVSVEERIKLTIDLNNGYYDYDNKIYESSIVDSHDGKFSFFFVNQDDVARFDVTSWDDEKVYCNFSTARPFTILEIMTRGDRFYNDNFVKNGKFYCRNNHTLMVFDVRSNSRIRKLGHFVRMDYYFEDLAVLEDGDILLSVRWVPEFLNRSDNMKYYLYLLKNPE